MKSPKRFCRQFVPVFNGPVYNKYFLISVLCFLSIIFRTWSAVCQSVGEGDVTGRVLVFGSAAGNNFCVSCGWLDWGESRWWLWTVRWGMAVCVYSLTDCWGEMLDRMLWVNTFGDGEISDSLVWRVTVLGCVHRDQNLLLSNWNVRIQPDWLIEWIGTDRE